MKLVALTMITLSDSQKHFNSKQLVGLCISIYANQVLHNNSQPKVSPYYGNTYMKACNFHFVLQEGSS